MSYTPYVLLIALVLVGAGGYVYLNRPFSEPDLSFVKPSPSPSMIDDTVKWPPLRPSGSAGQAPQQSEAPQVDSAAKKLMEQVKPINETVKVTLKTSMGDIVVELDGAKAPLTVGNFVALANNDFYDGTTFHRVIPDFMVQGGDPLSADPMMRQRHGTGGPGYAFPDEINDRKLVRGSLAMANSGPNTNGSQFFIVTAEATPWLDGKHTNFGTVVSGMDVVEKINVVETDERDNPQEAVTVQDVIVEK